jgi:ADP-ribose pyrophosphatase YjhB (NUDIX family)
MSHTYKYPRPALTVDCAVFGFDGQELNVLLIKRASEPYKGRWALPGGFVGIKEDLAAAARRELAEEAGVDAPFVEQLVTFGAVERNPRERSVSVCYYALTNIREHNLKPATDAHQAAWFPVSRLPKLASDHADMVRIARRRLQERARREPIGIELLPRKFTLTDLQRVYEALLDTRLDKRNFRKKILSFDFLVALNERTKGTRHRPAELFRSDRARLKRFDGQRFAL